MNSLPLDVKVERVDDLPLLMEHLKKMDVANQIDEHFPTHGNWQGSSIGWIVTVWLTHILSQANHYLSHVREWVAENINVLRELTGIETLNELDFTDDRLEAVLRYLNKDKEWIGYEQTQGEHLLRVYELPQEIVRLDTTTASTFQDENVDGLLRRGVSKDHRPDLAQLKVMLGVLDPLGLPLATQVVSGNCADDPLYIPAIDQVRKVLNRNGVLYVGDSKMSALETRQFIQEKGDYYLTPLPGTVITEDVLDNYLSPLWRMDSSVHLIPICRENDQGEEELIAEGFEVTEEITIEVNGEKKSWEERRLIVRSLNYAEAQIANLEKRLDKAKAQLVNISQPRRGKKQLSTQKEVELKIQEILKRFQVKGLLDVTCHSRVTERHVRGYKGKPSRTESHVSFLVEVIQNQEAIKKVRRRLGWRVYATNTPKTRFSFDQLIHVYRDQYIIERGYSRLKGRPLSMTPFHLQREDHITGMVRLLSIALIALTLFEFNVRQALKKAEEPLRGLYPGNPKRGTHRPSAELLLRAFRNITRVSMQGAPPQLIPLTEIQNKILNMMNFSRNPYIPITEIVLTG